MGVEFSKNGIGVPKQKSRVVLRRTVSLEDFYRSAHEIAKTGLSPISNRRTSAKSNFTGRVWL